MIFEVVRNGLAIIGIYFITRYFIIPIGDALLYAKGFLILHLLDVNWGKAAKKPHKFIKALISWYFGAIVDRLFGIGTVTEVRFANHKWKPYFHYKRID